MCFACYGHDRLSKGCMKKRTCPTCGRKHPTALHDDNYKPSQFGTNSTTVPKTTCSATDSSEDQVILQAILPVKVHQVGKEPTITYALYDNGSGGCFATNELLDEMGAERDPVLIQLRTMHGTTTSATSAVHDLIVTDWYGENPITLPKTYAKEEIPASGYQIPTPDVIRKWSHLQDICDKFHEYKPDLTIGLLIGSNCPRALEPLQVVPSESDGPYAVQLCHGWSVNGPSYVHISNGSTSCDRLVIFEDMPIKEAVVNLFEQDFNDKAQKLPDERGLSIEDQQFLNKANEGVKFVNGHYELPLPFRKADVSLPNNRGQAVKRLLWQKRKMLNDQKYHNDYTVFVNNILEKGYAQKIDPGDIEGSPGKLWYLPHHGVYNPNKPDKIRVVYDGSATFKDVSLNDLLIPGPNLTNSLVGVLIRFREDPVAFTGDIEAMFHQVHLPEHQRDFLRFLWWPDGDLSTEIQEYRMTVHFFGAVSSPSICNFALRRIPEDFELSPDVSCTIIRNFYVDDCLRSVSDEDEAVKLIQDLRGSLSAGGFHLTKF